MDNHYRDEDLNKLTYYSDVAAAMNNCGIMALILSVIAAAFVIYINIVSKSLPYGIIYGLLIIAGGYFFKVLCQCLAVFTEKNFRDAHNHE